MIYLRVEQNVILMLTGGKNSIVSLKKNITKLASNYETACQQNDLIILLQKLILEKNPT